MKLLNSFVLKPACNHAYLQVCLLETLTLSRIKMSAPTGGNSEKHRQRRPMVQLSPKMQIMACSVTERKNTENSTQQGK